MRIWAIALILSATVGAVAAPGSASAAQKHHAWRHRATAHWGSARPLTVQPRSYLDPGDNAPVGSLSEYVWAPMLPTAIDPTLSGGTGGRYGADVLPGPMFAPGRPQSLFDF